MAHLRSDLLAGRYFPHAPEDLVLLLGAFNGGGLSNSQWQIRYVCLLWLSLVVTIPFALDKFDDQERDIVAHTRLQTIIREWLQSSGPERDAAAGLAARYYGRRDVAEKGLASFLEWSEATLAAVEGVQAVYTVCCHYFRRNIALTEDCSRLLASSEPHVICSNNPQMPHILLLCWRGCIASQVWSVPTIKHLRRRGTR